MPSFAKPCASQRARWCREDTLREIRGPNKFVSQSRRFEVNVSHSRHGEHIENAPGFLRDFPIIPDGQQHMSGFAAIGDEYGAFAGGSLCPAGVLIEFAAG
jgi:hypothetical protein